MIYITESGLERNYQHDFRDNRGKTQTEQRKEPKIAAGSGEEPEKKEEKKKKEQRKIKQPPPPQAGQISK